MVKRVLLITFSCLSLYAYNDAFEREDENPSLFSAIPSSINPQAMQGQEITPDAGPRIVNGFDVFITTDFIWWKAYEEGLAYAQSGFETLSQTFLGSGSLYHPHFNFEPGLKVGLGLNLGRDGWDLYAEYTWLAMHPSKSLVSRDSTLTSNLRPAWLTIAPSGTIIDAAVPLISAEGRWNFSFNTLDTAFGRNFYISQFLTIRPFFGLKTSWQNQSYHVHYQTQITSNDVYQKIHIDQNFWGIGILGGFDTSWYLGSGFSIVGNLALSNLWSRFNGHRKDKALQPNINPNFVTTQNTENTLHTLKGVLETDIGFRWEIWWHQDRFHFRIDTFWEEQIWWSQNQFIKTFEENAHGDLTLHGLTLRTRLDF